MQVHYVCHIVNLYMLSIRLTLDVFFLLIVEFYAQAIVFVHLDHNLVQASIRVLDGQAEML